MTPRANGRTPARMAKDEPPPKPAAMSEREARLAQALRTNLRRRKTAAKTAGETAKKPGEGA